jgi:transcriptional regulator with XRE-family HTH domain
MGSTKPMTRPAKRSTEGSARRKSLGNAIRDQRKQQKLTQKALSKLIGKSVPTVSKIESGSHPLDIDTLSDLAKALNTTLTRLFWLSQRSALENDPGTRKIVPVLDGLLTSLEESGIKL